MKMLRWLKFDKLQQKTSCLCIKHDAGNSLCIIISQCSCICLSLQLVFVSFFTAWTEEQVVDLQQAVLRHRRGAISDYGKCFGVFSADLPAGCSSGELLAIISHLPRWCLLPLLIRPIYSHLGTLKEHHNWELRIFQLVNDPCFILKSLLSSWGTRVTFATIITCDKGGNVYLRVAKTLCYFHYWRPAGIVLY